jgi:phosphohistidine phosphatase
VEILLVRHAVAEEAAAAGARADARRRLTREGRRRMRLGAAGLRALVPAVELVASSPLVRAEETARIVAAGYGIAASARVTLPALAPGTRPAVAAAWIRARRAAGARGPLALVGHEPHLSRLAAHLLGARRSPFTFRKGGACLIELPPGRGTAVLRWLLGARALRVLGGGDADRG